MAPVVATKTTQRADHLGADIRKGGVHEMRSQAHGDYDLEFVIPFAPAAKRRGSR